MPTIEFFGYGDDERQNLKDRVRELIEREPFRDECVFVETERSHVRDWRGQDRPFLRISTRSAERAERFKGLLGGLCDLEVVRIDFQPMRGDGGAS